MVGVRGRMKVRVVTVVAGVLSAGLVGTASATAGAAAAHVVPTATAMASGLPSTAAGGRAPGAFVPVSPARLLDTRNGTGATGPVRAHGTVHLQVTGRGAVPSTGVAAVVLNVTVTAPARAGYVTAYPDGTSRPTASNLNYVARQTVADLVTVKVGTNGRVALTSTSAGTAQLIADVSGYYVAGAVTDPGGFVPVDPARLLDTRRGNGAAGPIRAYGTVQLQVSGRGAVPATGASAVVLTVTVTAPTSSGYVTAYPGGTMRPTASSLNFRARQTVPNHVTVKLGSTGTVALTNSSGGTVHLVADVAGYYLAGPATANGMFVPVNPTRLLDTRIARAPVPAYATTTVSVTHRPGTPTNGVLAAVLNVTAVLPSSGGHVTVYPNIVSRPNTSNLNFTRGAITPNAVMAPLGTDGATLLYNASSRRVDLLADLAGYVLFALPAPAHPEVTAQGSSTCAVTTAGAVRCWGHGAAGELGNGTTQHDAKAPVPVSSLSHGVSHLSSDGNAFCALATGGDVSCWGTGFFLTGIRSVPTAIGALGNAVVEVALSASQLCAVTALHGVVCIQADGSLVPNRDLSGVAALSIGGVFACAALDDGSARCWGDNYFGQLGNGSTISSGTPVRVAGLSHVVQVDTANEGACALTSDKTVYCWGYGWYGGLGNGTTSNSSSPVQVLGVHDAEALSSGWASCVIGTGGALRCWGANNFGEVGSGSPISVEPLPVDVVGLTSGVVDVSAGGSHACAVLASGSLSCWGDNTDGALGDGQDVTASRPVAVTGLGGPVSSVAVDHSHTCAVAGGGAFCWGSGALGTAAGLNPNLSSVPVPVEGERANIAQISGGYGVMCSRSTSGAVSCWGPNATGGLGDGAAEAYSDTPVPVSGILSGATDLSVGSAGHACAVVSGGARCWGSNSMGQLGDGTSTQRPSPVGVVGLGSGVAAISAGGQHTCALTSAGGVECWGNNHYGQLGNGTTGITNGVVQVTGLTSGVVAVSAGYLHTCAIMDDGTVVCWGANSAGQLGDGTTTGSTTPKPVANLPGGAVGIAAGSSSTCATTGNGAFCWGSNLHGLLGDGTVVSSQFRTPVYGIRIGATGVAAGPTRACAIVDGALSCWGDRTDGALGDGSSTRVPTPQAVLGF